MLPPLAGDRDPEAHKALLKGRQRMAAMTPAGFESARMYFEKALEIDPDYADAHAALAWLSVNLAIWHSPDPQPLLEQVRRSAQRALEASDEVAIAHGCLAFVHMYADWAWAAAESEWLRGLELAPSSAMLHIYYGYLLSLLGRHEEAVVEAYRAQELDPLAGLVNGLLGLILSRAGRFAEAVAELDRGTELDPAYWLAYSHRAGVHLYLGDYERAVADARKALSMMPHPLPAMFGALALERAGSTEEARELLELFESMADGPLMRPFFWVCLKFGRGELDEGFAWLERALDSKDGLALLFPEMPLLRDTAATADPRFAAARTRLNMPPRPPS